MERLNMSEMQTTDPAQLAELLAKVDAMKATFASLRQTELDRPKRGKVKEDLNELVKSDFPLILLNTQKYRNKKGEINDSSIRSQFKIAAKDMELDFEPSIVWDGTNLYCVNFDAENAEAKFNEYVLRTAGIDINELYAVTSDLDKATR